jgi:two-component system sensor histidine kinase FlrB
MTQPATGRSRQLEDAFNAFSRMSTQLEGSYRELERQVVRLTEELAAARSERLVQLAEKERLANRLERLLETLPGGVVVLDGAGDVVECNPAAIELLGEPLLGMAWRAVSRRAFSTHSSEGSEVTLDNGRRVSLSVRALGVEPGQIILLSDVTETRTLQNLVQHQQRLSAMGEMAAGLAHQIRTPLAAALLYVSHLQKPMLNDLDRQRAGEKIHARLRHLEHMVNDMLLFARGGNLTLDEIGVDTLLDELSQSLEPHLASANGTLRIVDRSAGLRLSAGRDALLSALLNLATNALQAGGRGARIDLTAERADNALVLTLADNGPGIDPALVERIFEPFFTTRPDGTGLGLAVVRAIIEAHRGTVRAVPLETGAGFVITLPTAARQEFLPSGVRDNAA